MSEKERWCGREKGIAYEKYKENGWEWTRERKEKQRENRRGSCWGYRPVYRYRTKTILYIVSKMYVNLYCLTLTLWYSLVSLVYLWGIFRGCCCGKLFAGHSLTKKNKSVWIEEVCLIYIEYSTNMCKIPTSVRVRIHVVITCLRPWPSFWSRLSCKTKQTSRTYNLRSFFHHQKISTPPSGSVPSLKSVLVVL